ncbi:VirB4-like conjugal transfer ATPase, CD1110 family [Ruminococcus sp. 5_1_39BFAA]|uniref:VirB4-like conjugal transfer ATPase, CD1110 family n=1 Tax=Ruminococcus sp. 5_1_39BFAA TaxID=457412 RepID=UPI003564F085
MKKRMQDYKQLTTRIYKVPKSVQELLPIGKISEDGIFQLEQKTEGAKKQFDKAYLFQDTNFAAMDEYEKEEFLKKWCVLLNSISVSVKCLVMNLNRDMKRAEEEVYLHSNEADQQELTEDFNAQICSAMVGGRNGIEQVRILVFSCWKQSAEQARDYFRSMEASLQISFKGLQSSLTPLTAKERFRYLHAFYRLGKEKQFQMKEQISFWRKKDWRDLIAPRLVKHYQDEYGTCDGITLQMEGRYVRTLYVPVLPGSINPEIVRILTSVPFHVILTCDAAPVPKSVAMKRLMELYMQNGRAIEKQQEARRKAGAWASDITYERRRERDELENYMDIVSENDEKLFYVGIYATLSAGSKQELENQVTAFCSIAEGEGFYFEPAYWQQIDALDTALPTGARFCSMMHPVFTQSLAAFTPFIVHEIYQPGGFFYGVNRISKNVIIADRKLLKNGNGFILGITGSGKSAQVKMLLLQIFHGTKDDLIIIDPQNEYKAVVAALGGQFIDFGAGSGHYINPLDMDNLNYMDSWDTFLMDKTELMLGIYAQILNDELTAQDKSIIGRCVRELYGKVGTWKKKSPTLQDFYMVMERQPEAQARELTLALELFVTGSLDMFSVQTNVNTKSRMTVYGLANLGKEMSGIGMLIMLESIRARIAENAKKGRATWLFIDEFHNLASDEFSARYLEKIWKEVRKMGGLCTAVTQNIADLLSSKTIETMLCNSEYLSLLNQSDIEIEILRNTLGISDNLLKYVHNVEPGCGLLKFGEKYIPNDCRLPKESATYQLLNTNFHEIQNMKQKAGGKKEIRNMIAGLEGEVRQMAEEEKEYP